MFLGVPVLVLLSAGPILAEVDKTIGRPKRRPMTAKGSYRDAGRSTEKHAVPCPSPPV